MPTETKYCYKHPNRETGLTCATCGKPICVDCMIQTPVGGKCRECGTGSKNPLTRVGALHYAIGLVVSLAAGTIGGFICLAVGWMLLIMFFLGPTIGGVIGDIIRRAVGRRYGLGLAVTAAVGMIGGLVIASIVRQGGMQNLGPALGRLLINPGVWIYLIFSLPAVWWRLR